MKANIFLLVTAVFVIGSIWITEKMQYKKRLAEKNENIRLLQEKLSKCTSNQIVFDSKVKKSGLNLRQLLWSQEAGGKKQDSCLTVWDTISIVAWWDNLKPRERKKYRKEALK